MKYRRTERGHYREESPKQGLISAKDLPMEHDYTNSRYIYESSFVSTKINRNINLFLFLRKVNDLATI